MAEAAAAAAAAEAAIQLQITRAVAAAMAAHIAGPGAAAVPVAHVAVKLPDFWVQDPHSGSLRQRPSSVAPASLCQPPCMTTS